MRFCLELGITSIPDTGSLAAKANALARFILSHVPRLEEPHFEVSVVNSAAELANSRRVLSIVSYSVRDQLMADLRKQGFVFDGDEPRLDPEEPIPGSATRELNTHKTPRAAGFLSPLPIPLGLAAAPIVGAANASIGNVVAEAAGTTRGQASAVAVGEAVVTTGIAKGQKQKILEEIIEVRSLLERLAAVVPALPDDLGEHAGIGHNRPPDPISESPIARGLIQESLIATRVIERELQANSPNVESLHLAGYVLGLVGSRLGKVASWAGHLGQVFAERFAKSAGTQAGKWFGPVGLSAFLTALAAANGSIADILRVINDLAHAAPVSLPALGLQ